MLLIFRTPRLTAKPTGATSSKGDGSPRKLDMTPKLGPAAPTNVVALNAVKQKNAEEHEKKMKNVEVRVILEMHANFLTNGMH